MKDIELKDRERKIKREIEELFFKQIIAFIDDMDKFEQKEMSKIRPIKTLGIPKPIWKSSSGFKDKVISLFQTNTPK